jgi:lysophospholipase L1-like esterase
MNRLDRILIVGDSHCKELDLMITAKYPNIQSLALVRGGNIQAVLRHFIHNAQIALAFDPTTTIIHVGHNNLAYHPTKNPHPFLSRRTATDTINLATQIQNFLPHSVITLSAVLPRSPKERSSMNETATKQYNKVAKKHGQRIRTEARRAGYHHLINSCMWRCISQAIEEESLYRSDGLHLNTTGKSILTQSWINNIAQGTTV